MNKPGKKGSRKIGNNKAKCSRYQMQNRRAKNKKRQAEKRARNYERRARIRSMRATA